MDDKTNTMQQKPNTMQQAMDDVDSIASAIRSGRLDRRIYEGKPASFGWLRLPDKDCRAGCDGVVYYECWERGDGGLIHLPRQKPDQPVTIIACARFRDRKHPVVIIPTGAHQ